MRKRYFNEINIEFIQRSAYRKEIKNKVGFQSNSLPKNPNILKRLKPKNS